MKNDAYRFGFAISELNHNINQSEIRDWKQIKVDQYQIHIHPEVEYQTTKTEYGTALVIGDVFVCQGEQNITEITSLMLKEDAWDHFDNLTGRFALILFSNINGIKVMNDPFGSRTIYYRNEGEFGISSHSMLLASMFGDELSEEIRSFKRSPEYRMRGTGYLPGDSTMYENIKTLIPNNYYDVEKRATTRYWPRKPIKSMTMEQFLEHCDEYFERFSSFIKKYNLILGLTGGVDTRALIAGLRGKGCNMKLITWNPSKLPEGEKEVIDEMATYLKYEHIYLDATKREETEEYKRVAKASNKAGGFSRGSSAITVHIAGLVNDNDVFIRGFGGEILRGFYSRHKSPMSGDMLQDFYKLYLTKRVKEPSDAFSKFILESTSGFIQRANYDQNFFNLDVRDLFYWEQRMGTWGANVLNEMDPSVYSYSGLNSRPLYEAALGLPEEERLGAEIMVKITALYDKHFSGIGIVS